MALSAKQQAFVEHYLQCWNASEAARRAGYSEKTAAEQGSRLLRNVNVDAAIKARVEELKMSADEVLVRLAEQARGATEEFIVVRAGLPFFDWERLQAARKLHLVKKLKYSSDGRPEVEFYDAQAALVHLGRAHSLFTDNVDVKSGGKALKGYVGISPDDWDDDGDGETDEDPPTASASDPAR